MNRNMYYPIILIALGLVGMGLLSCHSHSHDHGHAHGPAVHNLEKIVRLNETQFELAKIDTGWFEARNIHDVIHANGHTQLDPQNQADVSMPVHGTIQTIRVIEGDYVKKGQTIATMHSLAYNDLLLERAKLSQHQAESEAQIAYLESEYERQRVLSEENINARKLFQKVSADLEQARASVKAIQEQQRILNGTVDLIGPAEGSRIRIRAPISGYITHVYLKIGSAVEAGKTLFSIVDNSKMHVDLLVYEKDLNKIQVGQSVRFVLTNQSNREINGRIYNIGQAFENDTKSVAVHADIETNDAKLIPGMYVNALINIGSNTVSTLPTEAIVQTEGRSFVYILEGPDQDLEGGVGEGPYAFTRREVMTGPSQLGFTQVTPLQEIAPADRIVTRGAYYIQSHLQKSEGAGSHSH